MENATKALLIAASVLIVIVLIAVGVLLLGKTSDTSEQAGQVGNSLSLATDSAADDIFGGRIVQTEDLKRFWEEDAKMEQVLNGMTFGPTVKVTAYFFQGYHQNETWYSTEGEVITPPSTDDKWISKWIPEQLRNKQLKKIQNPINYKDIGSLYFFPVGKKYKDKGKNPKNVPLVRWTYLDEDGNVISNGKAEKMIYIFTVQIQ